MRGRVPQPDDMKEARGNPGRRPLGERAERAERLGAGAPIPLTIPDFLTHPREREIFVRAATEALQRRLARASDLTAFARWASYVHRWVTSKEALGDQAAWYESTSRHGTMFRRHPLLKDMIDMERLMQSLEDRLGLNPLSRQNILRGLVALPPALGDLFPVADDGGDEAGAEPAAKPDDGALGFLQRAALGPPREKPN
jgi:phage terminase small subunit